MRFTTDGLDRRLLVLACLLLGLAGCICTPGAGEKVSDDQAIQLKFETAKRALADIKQLKLQGRSIYADCTTARMLFVKDLKALKESPAAASLVKELAVVCKGAKPF